MIIWYINLRIVFFFCHLFQVQASPLWFLYVSFSYIPKWELLYKSCAHCAACCRPPSQVIRDEQLNKVSSLCNHIPGEPGFQTYQQRGPRTQWLSCHVLLSKAARLGDTRRSCRHSQFHVLCVLASVSPALPPRNTICTSDRLPSCGLQPHSETRSNSDPDWGSNRTLHLTLYV